MEEDFLLDEEKLSQRSDELSVRKENKDVKAIVLKLKQKIRENNLLCLSAPQIGIFKRILVLNFNNDYRAFVNPVITKAEGLSFNKEQVPNLPGKLFLVPRYNNIDVTFLTANGNIQSYNLLGVAAHMMQQMVDALEGILISDIGYEIDENFDTASDDEKEKIMSLFLEAMDLKRDELEKEINENDDLLKMRDSIKFINSVKSGETKIEAMDVNIPKKEPLNESAESTENATS